MRKDRGTLPRHPGRRAVPEEFREEFIRPSAGDEHVTMIDERQATESHPPAGPVRREGAAPSSPRRTTTGRGRRVALAGVVLAGLVLAACSSGASSATPATAGGAAAGGSSGHSVTIQNFAFHPSRLTVPPGTVVTVTNKDSVVHTLTSTTNAFNTGDIQPGQSKSFTAPNKPGTYPYICEIHQYMTGTITVS